MRLLSIDPAHPAPEIVREAAEVLQKGGLVAFPTETVYGLGGNALDPRAVRRIFEAKGRPKAHPLIAHVIDAAEARALTTHFGAVAERLATAFWPGPLTLVLPRAAHVPPEVAGGGATLAVRAPSHPVARALIAALGAPIAAPSANRYQTLSPTTAAHVAKSLGDDVDLVLDGGAAACGIESTVVDASGDEALVLRPGAIDLASLRAALSGTAVRLASAKSDELAQEDLRPSPGMDPRHYAPRAKLVVVRGRASLVERAGKERVHGGSVGILALGAIDAAGAAGAVVRVLPTEPASYAAGLFAALHDLDDAGAAVILAEEPPDDEAWLAVRDRLRRASTP